MRELSRQCLPRRTQASQQEFLQVDTSNILFICGGAFAGLDKIVRERSEKGGIGFSAEVKTKSEKVASSELLHSVEPEDLIRYGLIPEFVGRLPVVAVLNELNQAQLVEILLEPKTQPNNTIGCLKWNHVA